MLPYTERNWVKVLTEIGRADVAETCRWFKNATERSRRVDELYDILAEALVARTTEEWLAIFVRLDIPSQPVRLPADLLKRPPPRRRRLLQAELQRAHPGHTHPAPGRDRRRDDRRRLARHPRRYRRHPAGG